MGDKTIKHLQSSFHNALILMLSYHNLEIHCVAKNLTIIRSEKIQNKLVKNFLIHFIYNLIDRRFSGMRSYFRLPHGVLGSDDLKVLSGIIFVIRK